MSAAAKSRRRSQVLRTMDVFNAANGAEVPAPRLAAISLQYGRVIHSLRRLGYSIENRIEYREGVAHGFFRMVSAPRSPSFAQANVSRSAADQSALFF